MRALPSLLLAVVAVSLLAACEETRDRPSGSTPRASDGGTSGATDGGTTTGGMDASVVTSACTTTADCASGVCDRVAGRCAECRTSDECAGATRCEDGRCVATETCRGDLDCTPAGRVCDTAGGRCVACNSAAECGDAPCLGHACVGTHACTSSLECTDLQMVCGTAAPPAWPASFLGMGCGECNTSGDCGDREACANRLCVAACLEMVCGTDQGVSCGTCPDGAQCVDNRYCASTVFTDEVSVWTAAERTVWVASDGRSGGTSITAIALDASGGSQPILPHPLGTTGYIDALGANSTHLYWVLTDGSILRRPTGGGAAERFAQVPGLAEGSTSVWCQDLAVNDAVLVCDLVDYDDKVPDGLYVYALSGGMPRRISDLAQVSLYLDGDVLYVSGGNTAELRKITVSTGASTTLTRAQADVFFGVVDGTLYYSSWEGSFAVSASGGTPRQLFPGLDLVGLAGSTLYFYDRGTRTLKRAAIGASTTTDVASSLEAAGDVSVLRVLERSGALYVLTRYGVVRLGR